MMKDERKKAVHPSSFVLHHSPDGQRNRPPPTKEGSPVATIQPVAIGNLACGPGRPLLWIAGPCVIESHDLTLTVAGRLRELADRLGLPLVFKASFDKANRTSGKS